MLSAYAAAVAEGVKSTYGKIIAELPNFANDMQPNTNSFDKADATILNNIDFFKEGEKNANLLRTIEQRSPYNIEVNKMIRSGKELEVYTNANLKEMVINDKIALTRDIKPDFIDPLTGETNKERMEKGKSPLDYKTGEKIELHHIGQKMNSPLAELKESEHESNYSELHQSRGGSEINRSVFDNKERIAYWMARAKMY